MERVRPEKADSTHQNKGLASSEGAGSFNPLKKSHMNDAFRHGFSQFSRTWRI
jgi:hypothetical protein